jgi:hypothetical protein
VEGHREGHRFVALAFDVRQSDLPLRVAWPLFVLNAIDRFTEEDAAYLSSYRTGEPWYVGVPAGTERASLRAPDGSEQAVPIVDGRAICTGTRAGFYTLVSTLAGGEAHEEILAANLGPSDESTLTPRTELPGAELAPEPTLATARDRAPLWTWLLVAAALALMIEWLTFHRRWTV